MIARPADGPPFEVRDQGAGPVVLLVHGGSGTVDDVAPLAGLLAERFRVLSFTRRPYRGGLSSSMSDEVQDVLAVAAGLDAPALLFGHSSGAVVALQAALAAPGAFAGLVAYEPPLAVHSPLGGAALHRARAALDAGDPGGAMTIHLREIVQVPGWQVRLLRWVPPLWARLKATTDGQIQDDESLDSLPVGLERFESLDVPVVLLGGDRSLPHLRTRLDALATVLPRLESTVILPRQGHSAVARAPRQVADVIGSLADRVL